MEDNLFYYLKGASEKYKKRFISCEGKFYSIEKKQYEHGGPVWDIMEIDFLKIPDRTEEDKEGYD